MKLAWAFIKRDFLIATSYKLDFAIQLLRVLAVIPICYFLTRAMSQPGGQFQEYGAGYFAFLLIGLAFLDYLGVSLRTFDQSLRDSQLMGTLEIMLLSPTSLPGIVICSSAWVYLFATLRFIMYLLGGALFGLDLSHCNLPALLTIGVIAVAGFAGFGMFTASITVVAKRGLGLNLLMTLATLFCAGVLFPNRGLWPPLERIAQFLPMTHALHGIRRAVLEGAGVIELLPVIGILLLFDAVLVPLGLGTFWWAVRHSKRVGTLAQY